MKCLILLILALLFSGVNIAEKIEQSVVQTDTRLSVAECCGAEIPEGAQWSVQSYDCETGPGEETPLEEAPDRIVNGRVTGKANDMSVTGGTVIYICRDAAGNRVASFEFYGDWLVMPDGMYNIAY